MDDEDKANGSLVFQMEKKKSIFFCVIIYNFANFFS